MPTSCPPHASPNAASVSLLRALAAIRRGLGQARLAADLEALADRQAGNPLAWEKE